jgi:hypothetical protein
MYHQTEHHLIKSLQHQHVPYLSHINSVRCLQASILSCVLKILKKIESKTQEMKTSAEIHNF